MIALAVLGLVLIVAGIVLIVLDVRAHRRRKEVRPLP